MAIQHTRFAICVGRAARGTSDLVVKAEFPLDLNVSNEISALARKSFAFEVLCEQGRFVGGQSETVTALFRASDRANAFTFLDQVLQILCEAEDAERKGAEEEAGALLLYRFERVFGPSIYLALHASRRADEAYAILVGAEVIEDDDDIDEDELAEVEEVWAQSVRVDDQATLWEKFSAAKEPCYLAVMPVY